MRPAAPAGWVGRNNCCARTGEPLRKRFSRTIHWLQPWHRMTREDFKIRKSGSRAFLFGNRIARLRLLWYRHTEFAQLLFRLFVVRLEPQCFGKMRYGFLSMSHAFQEGAENEMGLRVVVLERGEWVSPSRFRNHTPPYQLPYRGFREGHGTNDFTGFLFSQHPSTSAAPPTTRSASPTTATASPRSRQTRALSSAGPAGRTRPPRRVRRGRPVGGHP